MIGARINRARRAAGLPLRALAAQCGVSAMAISKYERGEITPSSDVLLALATALGVRLEYFFREHEVELEEVEYRKHPDLPEKAKKRILANVRDQLERWLALEEFIPTRWAVQFRVPSGLPEKAKSLDDVETVASAVRRAWKLGESAIPNLIDTFELQGIKVFTTPFDGENKVDGLSAKVNDKPVVAIRDKDCPGDRQRFTLEVSSKLIFAADGRPLGIHAIARDVSDRKEAEARQHVLISELQHRSKNLIAVVQSIVTNSLLHSRDVVAAKDAIVGRLHALGNAQDFVVSGASGGVPIRDLLEAELSGFAARTHMTGIPLILGSAFAQQFALVIHELATNAAKYGSLSIPNGRLVLGWEIAEMDEEPTLRFWWTERDGPPVAAPVDRGFGSKLISMTLSTAPRISYDTGGFEFAVEVPLSEVMRVANQKGRGF